MFSERTRSFNRQEVPNAQTERSGLQKVRQTLSTLLHRGATQARVRAWLLPVFMAWGCASGAQHAAPHYGHDREHAEGSDIVELTENGVERVWTVEQMLHYLETRLGHSQVQRFLLGNENEPSPEIRRAQAEQERRGPRAEITGAENFGLTREIVGELLDSGYPRSWTRQSSVDEVEFTTTLRRMSGSYGMSGYEAGHCRQGRGSDASHAVISRNAFFDEAPSGFELMNTISHELAHSVDWYSKGNASLAQRTRWLFWSVRRVESGRGLPRYVREIHNSDPERQLGFRAIELFAKYQETTLSVEAAAAQTMAPEHFESDVIDRLAYSFQITQSEAAEAYHIIQEMTVASDPEFDRRAAGLARWRFSRDAFRHALPLYFEEGLFARLPDEQLASDLTRELHVGILHQPTDAVHVLNISFQNARNPLAEHVDAATMQTLVNWELRQRNALNVLFRSLSGTDRQTFEEWVGILYELGGISRAILIHDASMAAHDRDYNEENLDQTIGMMALNNWRHLQERLQNEPLSDAGRAACQQAMDLVYGRDPGMAPAERAALHQAAQTISSRRHYPYAHTAL